MSKVKVMKKLILIVALLPQLLIGQLPPTPVTNQVYVPQPVIPYIPVFVPPSLPLVPSVGIQQPLFVPVVNPLVVQPVLNGNFQIGLPTFSTFPAQTTTVLPNGTVIITRNYW